MWWDRWYLDIMKVSGSSLLFLLLVVGTVFLFINFSCSITGSFIPGTHYLHCPVSFSVKGSHLQYMDSVGNYGEYYHLFDASEMACLCLSCLSFFFLVR